MSSISDQLIFVKSQISQASARVGRLNNSVQLIAVSKTHPASTVREAFVAGQKDFAENYVQEGTDKIAELDDLRKKIIWHFIGPVQSNKTRFIAESFDWVQSVDRFKIAQRLSDQRPKDMDDLNICLQVNISGEASKSGVSPEDALLTCLDIAELPNISLRGLMAIPEPGASLQSMKKFQKLFLDIQLHLKRHQFKNRFDTLSLGMSDDLERAIEAGSTMVRVGTAIFGPREPDVIEEDSEE
jgi:pyridoxal phosphate enzyme (YggS family)